MQGVPTKRVQKRLGGIGCVQADVVTQQTHSLNFG